MLNITNLYAGYTKNNPILKGIDLTIEEGQVIGILGRNGSGKSTLAKAICGLMPHATGEIFLNGQNILGSTPHEIARMGIGYFQQGGRVFLNLSVNENLAFAASTMDNDAFTRQEQKLSACFNFLQDKRRRKQKASYLSGGEKHQLALAMVLIQNPRLLILDEPSAGLSPANQKAMYDILNHIRQTTQVTMLIIEQNVELAKGFCDNLIRVMYNGELSHKEYKF